MCFGLSSGFPDKEEKKKLNRRKKVIFYLLFINLFKNRLNQDKHVIKVIICLGKGMVLITGDFPS